MRRLPTILLLIGFAALGSGLLEDLHLRAHLREQAAALHAVADPSAPHPQQDDGACELCATLHLPRLSTGWVPILVCLGVLVAFLTQLAPQLASQRVAARIDCRGPPVL